MRNSPSTHERCDLLLSKWRNNLTLNNFEESQLSEELKVLDNQLGRLRNKQFRVAVFGRVGVGKSSLLNALLGMNCFNTDVAHGSTRTTKSTPWNINVKHLNNIELIDTPGIDEIGAAARGRLARRISLQADLILLVIDSDITSIELDAITKFQASNKPIAIVLNRCDQWSTQDKQDLISSIRNRLAKQAHHLEIIAVAAAPRKAKLLQDSRVRSEPCSPKVRLLKEFLLGQIQNEGDTLVSLNSLRQAISFQHSLSLLRLKKKKQAAQSLIGKFAALKASGVAANPFCALDLAAGLALDTALVLQLSEIYNLEMNGKAARNILKNLSIYNSFLGAAQLGIQIFLAALRHLFLVLIPVSGGFTFGALAPIALTQAALAVYTTKLTGRLVAEELLHSSQQRELDPRRILRRLIQTDQDLKQSARTWSKSMAPEPHNIQTLLP